MLDFSKMKKEVYDNLDALRMREWEAQIKMQIKNAKASHRKRAKKFGYKWNAKIDNFSVEDYKKLWFAQNKRDMFELEFDKTDPKLVPEIGHVVPPDEGGHFNIGNLYLVTSIGNNHVGKKRIAPCQSNIRAGKIEIKVKPWWKFWGE